MAFQQVITPSPTVACTPGWCLKYVQDTFGLSAVYPTAIASWNASTTKHQDRNFPANCWVPVWFSLRDEPAGHVALLAPDGSVYSSSDPNTNVPHHHPSLDALITYYAKANPLTYLGWTEDVEGTPVIKEEDMPLIENREQARLIYVVALHRDGNTVSNKELDGLVGQDVYKVLDRLRSDTPDGAEWNQANDILGRDYPLIKGQLAEAQQKVAGTSNGDKLVQAMKDALGIK